MFHFSTFLACWCLWSTQGWRKT